MSLETLALAWYLIIGFVIILYVLLDGYDLGIGILSIFFPGQEDKDTMISVIIPVWDGNGTWLVFGGAALYAAFPLAFSLLMPAVYLPTLVMVVSLLLRGVSLEFRLKAHTSRWVWDGLFFLGSLVATICQALILTAIIGGFVAKDGAVSVRAWINPLVYVSVPGLILGYMLLGVDRLLAKTAGLVQAKFFKASSVVQYLLAIMMSLAAIISPVLDHDLVTRWWNSSVSLYLGVIAVLLVWCFVLHVIAIVKGNDRTPFLFTVLMFLCSFAALVLSTFPYLIPNQVTILMAVSPRSSLLFMLFGALICIPLLLIYTSYAYYVFRGKITKPIKY